MTVSISAVPSFDQLSRAEAADILYNTRDVRVF